MTAAYRKQFLGDNTTKASARSGLQPFEKQEHAKKQENKDEFLDEIVRTA